MSAALAEARRGAELEQTSTQASAAALAFGVAPNPSAGLLRLQIDLPEAADIELAVYDALGRRVMALAESELDAGRHAVPLDLSALPAGIYLARMHVLQTGHVEATRFTLAR